MQASKWHALEGGALPFSAALFAAPDEVAQSAKWVKTHWPVQQASGTALRQDVSRGGCTKLRRLFAQRLFAQRALSVSGH